MLSSNKIKPSCSVIILTKNGGSVLIELIDALLRQVTSFSFEIIIVDSGSTDGIIEKLSLNYTIRLYHIRPEEFSFGPTRDYAFSLARGNYIVTLSQDVVPANEHWLHELVAPLMDGNADVSQGLTILPLDRRSFFWDRKGMFYFTQECRKFARNNGKIGLSCCSFAITRKAWEETGFGDAPMSEDKEIQKRLVAKGFRMQFAEESLAYHGHDYDLVSLAKRCENEGFGWRAVGVDYTFGELVKDLFQPKWVYGVLLRGVLSGELKTLAEILFLLVRPIAVFKGNRFNKEYRF